MAKGCRNVRVPSLVCLCFIFFTLTQKLPPHLGTKLLLESASKVLEKIVNFLSKYTTIQKPFMGWFSLVGR